jgi:hypothetical protein
MHYDRIHVKQGKSMPRKRKYMEPAGKGGPSIALPPSNLKQGEPVRVRTRRSDHVHSQPVAFFCDGEESLQKLGCTQDFGWNQKPQCSRIFQDMCASLPLKHKLSIGEINLTSVGIQARRQVVENVRISFTKLPLRLYP